MLWLLFVVLPIGHRGLWDPDEHGYLQVAWEMAHAKSYIVPIMNAETYAEKPPLYFWLTMGFSKIFPWKTASRWVSLFYWLQAPLKFTTYGSLRNCRD